MSFNLRHRSFLKELDFTPAEMRHLLKLAADLKAAKYAGYGVPVWNGLTDEFHPTQILADVLTMTEHSVKDVKQISFCYLGAAASPIARVPYGTYLRWVWPLLAMLAVLSVLGLGVGALVA